MERIVIMARDDVGVLADITSVLAQASVNLESINTQVNGEHGTIIISTDDTNRALTALAGAGYSAVTDDALLIRLKDEAGALARVAQRFSEAGINIRSVHILDRKDGFATIALSTSTDDRPRAEALVGPEERV
ncbi:MAG: ACT domain-containing protein [Chloroflexi bacterium]|nr:ACT domain-containing protein [Chloroflexota bacterium]